MGLDFFTKVRIFARSWNVLKNWYVYPLVYFNLTKKPHVIFETKSGIKLKIRTKTTDLMALTNIWLIQEYLDDEFEEVSERISMAEDGANEVLGGAHAIIDVEESAFGRKIRKRKKKMETRLLKEILNDVKSLRFK